MQNKGKLQQKHLYKKLENKCTCYAPGAEGHWHSIYMAQLTRAEDGA